MILTYGRIRAHFSQRKHAAGLIYTVSHAFVGGKLGWTDEDVARRRVACQNNDNETPVSFLPLTTWMPPLSVSPARPIDELCIYANDTGGMRNNNLRDRGEHRRGDNAWMFATEMKSFVTGRLSIAFIN